MTESLASRLKDLRVRSGRSAMELSTSAGLSKNTVAEIEANPDRSPRVEAVRKLAKILGVSVAYLIEGRVENERTGGFSESDATPWEPPPASGREVPFAEHRSKIARTLAPRARQPATFRLGRDAPGFNLEAGDVLIVDLSRPAQAGELVLANVVDLVSGAGVTVLRRYLTPYLVPSDSSRSDDMLLADGTRTVVMGPIVGSFRAPDMDAA